MSARLDLLADQLPTIDHAITCVAANVLRDAVLLKVLLTTRKDYPEQSNGNHDSRLKLMKTTEDWGS